jgi:8-oxo-dGTP diphosphatase
MADRFTTHVAVFVVVRNKNGEILLQQRANTGFLDGYWDFPSGHLEPGESLIEAARRELHEEVGLTVAESDLQLVHINQNHLDTPYMSFTFLAHAWEGEPKIGEPDKCSALAFFAPDKLPAKCSLGVRVNEHNEFGTNLGYTFVNRDNFESYMGEPFDSFNWDKK